MGTKPNLVVAGVAGVAAKWFWQTDNKTALIVALATFSALSIINDAE